MGWECSWEWSLWPEPEVEQQVSDEQGWVRQSDIQEQGQGQNQDQKHHEQELERPDVISKCWLLNNTMQLAEVKS